jgi:Ran GTPase-activating protein (RanGAP) involved in mRNA processing and transport
LVRGPEIGDAGVLKLAEALEITRSPSLRKLSVTEASLTDEGCTALARVIQFGGAPGLRELTLASNQIREGGARAIADAVEAGALANLERLDLSSNQLNYAGRAVILMAVRRPFRCLKMRADGLEFGGQGCSCGGRRRHSKDCPVYTAGLAGI